MDSGVDGVVDDGVEGMELVRDVETGEEGEEMMQQSSSSNGGEEESTIIPGVSSKRDR